MTESNSELPPTKDVAVHKSTVPAHSASPQDLEVGEQNSGAKRLGKAVLSRLDSDGITITPTPGSNIEQGAKTITVIDSADGSLHFSLCIHDDSQRLPGKVVLGARNLVIRWFNEAKKTAGETVLYGNSTNFSSIQGDIPEAVYERERERWDLVGGGYAYFPEVWTTNKTEVTDTEYAEFAEIINEGHVNDTMVGETKKYFSDSASEEIARFEAFEERWRSQTRSLPTTDVKAIGQ